MNSSVRFWWTALGLAFSALLRTPLRAVLTAFGIFVGVAAVTIVVALGEGASLAVGGAIQSLGASSLEIFPRARERSGVRSDAPPSLTEQDAAALPLEAPSIALSAPFLETGTQVMSDGANATTRVQGTTLSYFKIRDWKISLGELWTPGAEVSRERVCVLGQSVRAELFGDSNPVGRRIRVGRHSFLVVGVLAPKGQGAFGMDFDDFIVMPVGSLRSKLLPTRPGQVHRIIVGAVDADAVTRAEHQAVQVLRQRHGLTEGAPNDFRVRSLEEVRKTQEQIVGTVRTLLLAVALVSLLVGGIGVMNIMLVGVTQRRREIGVRMALGARERDIIAQFLTEAVVLSVLGGLSGAIASIAAIAALAKALDLPMKASPAAAAVALVTSALVGIVFGFLPARQAARLDPIEAIRRD